MIKYIKLIKCYHVRLPPCNIIDHGGKISYSVNHCVNYQ